MHYRNIGIIIVLADISNAYLKGVLDDILIQVNKMLFPVDFYVLGMQDETNSISTLILLGRPLKKTTRTKYDAHNGTLTMEFNGESKCFNIFEAMRHPNDSNSYYYNSIVDSYVK